MLDPRGLIKKANLRFAAKFIWLVILHRLSPTDANNILTWDRAILDGAMVTGFEIDISRLLLSVIHERDFKSSTT